MWFDETPRLFSVAEILKKKKNKDDNYEIDDFPDVKKQELTGKYDPNFDALGSDFERAHNYNLSNIQQPESTKPDIEYSDKYNNFFKYEPSSYVKLEEDEYKPFSKYDEKANEYYIDNLQGKTLDDLIISKMKENAGAEDLPRDAMRRQFAEDLVRNERSARIHSAVNITEDNNLAPVMKELQKRKKHKKDSQNKFSGVRAAGIDSVVIEPPLSTSSERRSNRQKGITAPVVGISPEPKNQRKHKSLSSLSSTQNPDKNEQQAILNSLQDVKSQSKKGKSTTVGNVLGSNQLSQDYLDSLDDHLGGGGAVQKYVKPQKQEPKQGSKTTDNLADKKTEPKQTLQSKTTDNLTDSGVKMGDLESRLAELREQKKIEDATEAQRKIELSNLIPEVEKLVKENQSNKTKDVKVSNDLWVKYQALVRFYGGRSGNKPLLSTALTRLKNIYKNFEELEDKNKLLEESDDSEDEEFKVLKQKYERLNNSKIKQKQIPFKRDGQVVKTFTTPHKTGLLSQFSPSPNKVVLAPISSAYSAIGGNVQPSSSSKKAKSADSSSKKDKSDKSKNK